MPHKDAVTQQFDQNAESYRTSPVHAQGPDLALFRQHAQALHPSHAVDIGCGAGHAAYAIAPFCTEIDATDGSQAMLAIVADEARRRGFAHLRTVQAHAEMLPYADASVDFVTCRYSAHHWLNLSAGLTEIRRILPVGGSFIITDSVGADSALVDTHLQAVELLRDRTHVRSRRTDEWQEELERCGFFVETVARGHAEIGFADWVARANTALTHVPVIRELLLEAPVEVREALAVQPDGSFRLDIVTLVARAQ